MQNCVRNNKKKKNHYLFHDLWLILLKKMWFIGNYPLSPKSLMLISMLGGNMFQ